MKIDCSYSTTGYIKPTNKNSFKAINLHILDGSNHGDNMKHFAQAIFKDVNKDIDIKMHNVDINSVDSNLKQMNSLESVIKSLADKLNKGDYLAIPGLAPVSILNLKDRINYMYSMNEYLTPQNIKNYKTILLGLLERFYHDKSYSSQKQLNYMDHNQQELGYTFGVIQEINKLVKKGVNVYIPAGHGYDSAIKWMSGEKNLRPELYKFISQGKDNIGVVSDLFKEIQKRNFYDFNILSLSDAHIVNVNGIDGKKYVYSAADGYVNDSERGVFNFTPIRDWNGEVLGYSYHDKKTIEYPFNEFTANDEIANLCKYVGKQYSALSPDYNETIKLKKRLKMGRKTSDLPDKLYSLYDIYEQREIDEKKLNLLGHLTDKDRSLIFDTNNEGEILFHKTNCEGSSRPSVLQMWGSCFSTLNAIKRDILRENVNNKYSASELIAKADSEVENSYFEGAEYYYNKALDILHPNRLNLDLSKSAYLVYKKLYNVLKKSGKTGPAKNVANTIIDFKSQRIKDKWSLNPIYIKERLRLSKYYNEMADLCEKDNELYAAKVCRWAANELTKNSDYANKIIRRRADRNSYIGDLYDEYYKN